MIQKSLFIAAMLIAAVLMTFAAYKLGCAVPRPIPPIYMIYNVQSGDVSETRDEREAEHCLRNKRLRVFTFTPAEQFLEISFERIHNKRVSRPVKPEESER